MNKEYIKLRNTINEPWVTKSIALLLKNDIGINSVVKQWENIPSFTGNQKEEEKRKLFFNIIKIFENIIIKHRGKLRKREDLLSVEKYYIKYLFEETEKILGEQKK